MRLSTKARYATRALIELAHNYGQGPVRLKDIAKNQDISAKYLEQVLFPLNIIGIVRARKGSGGGHYLGKPPGEITLGQIVKTVEGSIAPVECVENPRSCKRYERCTSREVWEKLGATIESELESISLEDLTDRCPSEE